MKNKSQKLPPPSEKLEKKSMVTRKSQGAGRVVSRVRVGSGIKELKEDVSGEVLDNTGIEEWLQPKQLLKPPDQLQLSETELRAEFTRILTANNPNAPQNIVRYSFTEGCFKPVPQIDQLAIHYSVDGCVLHKDSEEARRQATKRSQPELTSTHSLDSEDEYTTPRADLDESTQGGELDEEGQPIGRSGLEENGIDFHSVRINLFVTHLPCRGDFFLDCIDIF